eukprot:Skav230250  [mRNA]  locus=scaffold1520:20627:24494:+ [translate_table: standard]
MKTKSIDYKGDEVKVARWFEWGNIAPAFPAEIGRVPLADVCERGCREYVLHFDDYLKPKDQWIAFKPPRVMVPDGAWGQVCQGLVEHGVCTFLREEDVFLTPSGPLLNGLFGVSKEEWTPDGTEIFRLIMNLIPLNGLCRGLSGDVDTLPAWSSMNPFFLQPTECLLVSSEDIRCFFYTMSVPPNWVKYLAFNKPVPQEVVPTSMKGETVYLASVVLPMGFLNSVSLAQHVHRTLVSRSSLHDEFGECNPPQEEIRKDRPLPSSTDTWRVYLDNYDLLEKVKATSMIAAEGTCPPAVLALRHEYEQWGIPRNIKKAVERSTRCELQGATVDGQLGLAFPREGPVYRSTPEECKVEILRFLGMLPLVRMDFRLPMHAMVTCSDASTTGGGICQSIGLTEAGAMVAEGGLRGDIPEARGDFTVLSIGLFDGIAALRVALDLVGVQVLGHVSVESNPHAQRVVEAHFPGTICVSSVQEVTEEMILSWSCRFSQCALVLLGAGPPCQGVSGLNFDRKGALRDERSSLFHHVPRIRTLLRKHFRWCPVHSIMELVLSMDIADREIMTASIGDEPIACDAGCFTLCHRPRIYWLSWDVVEAEGVSVDHSKDLVTVVFEGQQAFSDVLREGWTKVCLDMPFPTFTTSRPRSKAGRKPAGIGQCTLAEVQRWVADDHRYPPYQYKDVRCLKNARGELRLPDVAEREALLGFPVGYTVPCVSKQQRKTVEQLDIRKTLLGNTWSVPVVAVLLGQLFSLLGWISPLHPEQVLARCRPGGHSLAQGRLARLPLNPCRRKVEADPGTLAAKPGNLVSIKGEDILLSTPTSQLVKFHRLRASVPARLWRWQIVSGWKWSHPGDHINTLELRAVLSSLRYRIEHRRQLGCRMIHLVDSLVCLHALARGRSSSRRLRRTLVRVNALILAGNVQPVCLDIGRKRVLEALLPEDRAAQRQRLGTLRELTVQPATKRRYNNATQAFFDYLKTAKLELPRDKPTMDLLVCDFLEHLWSSGAGRAQACDTLAGLQDIQPGLRNNLPGAWRLLKTWSVNEVPCRAPPLPEHIVKAMAGWAFFKGYYAFGVSLLVGFYTMLRTGEILNLRSSHMMCGPKDQQIVVSLGLTKAGKRQGAAESVILGFQPAVKLTKRWKSLAPLTATFVSSSAKWRRLFSDCLAALDLDKTNFGRIAFAVGGRLFGLASTKALTVSWYKDGGPRRKLLEFI